MSSFFDEYFRSKPIEKVLKIVVFGSQIYRAIGSFYDVIREDLKYKKEENTLVKKYISKQVLLIKTKTSDIIKQFQKCKNDPRPYALTGNIHARDLKFLSQEQKKYLDLFYQRRLKIIRKLKHNPAYELQKNAMQWMYWKEVYRKIYSNNFLSKNKILDEKIINYVNKALHYCGIHSSSILIKKLSENHKKNDNGLIKLGHARLPIKVLWPNIYILSPIIALNNEINDVAEMYSTILHEIGHIYLCHAFDHIVLEHGTTPYEIKFLQFLIEIEADCILPILNKKYAEVILKSYCKELNKFFDLLKANMQFTNILFDKQLTYMSLKITNRNRDLIKKTSHYQYGDDIYETDRPSFFECFLHILDVCTQLWNLDITDFIHNPLFVKYIEEILNRNQTNRFYKDDDIISHKFSLKIDRITLDSNKKLFKSIV